MQPIVVLGAGKIGRMVTNMLARTGGYRVRVGDQSEPAVQHLTRQVPELEGRVLAFDDSRQLDEVLKGAAAVLACGPFHANPRIAERARAAGAHYLDLTEDVAVTEKVMELAKGSKTALIPQCGLAPGFITIVAMHLLKPMQDVSELRLRVGALPRFPSNMLKYNLTWSTEGLINEYCNLCEVVLDGELRMVPPMENLETVTIDGVEYEAFNTSGGLSTLAQSLAGKVRNVNYKSLRYPGHNHLIKFLLSDLQMRDRQELLREIFDRSLPTTFHDQVVVFVTATGMYRGRLTERVYARTIYHRTIYEENWSAIQITTAAGICGVLDLLLEGKLPQAGLVRQEQVDYDLFIKNRFGRWYAGEGDQR